MSIWLLCFCFFSFLYDNGNAIRCQKKGKRRVLVVDALLLLIASLASNFQCSGFPFSLLMMPYSCGSNMVRISCNTLKRLNGKMCPG